MTMARLHFSQRDLRTNLANIRRDVINDSISSSQFRILQLNESRYEVKLKVPSNVLNPEEASLLRDAGPNAGISATGIMFTWVFPKRFYEENKDSLKDMLCQRLNKDVKQEYDARRNLMSEQKPSRLRPEVKAQTSTLSRLLNVIQRERRPKTTGFDLGM